MNKSVKYWRLPHLAGVEMLRAQYTTQTFSRHIHEGYALGVIEQGALAFSYRGEQLVAPAGAVNLVIPGEAHDGKAASPAGWSYRMFYLAPEWLEKTVHELHGKWRRPYFSAGVLEDDLLAGQIQAAHRSMEDSEASILEQETRLISLLSYFVSRHSDRSGAWDERYKQDRSVMLARQYIEEHYAESITMRQLVQICHLSAFHLIRLFRRQVGVPPHMFLKQVRVRRSREFLDQGMTPAAVAQMAGFVDQSHFTRQFRQMVGMTPCQYSNFIQYGPRLIR